MEKEEIEKYNNELKQYAHTRGYIFSGDKVIIARGRKMKGEIKEVKAFYSFTPKYSDKRIDYVYFTDNTKVLINHCNVVGVDYSHLDTDFIKRRWGNLSFKKLEFYLWCGLSVAQYEKERN